MTTQASTLPRPATVTRGSRLVLAGVVLYLLEWVAIVAAGGVDVLLAPGTPAALVLRAYAGQADAFAWAAGWFSVVLVGRVLFVVAVRSTLPTARHIRTPADLAVITMGMGVVFEVAAYALVMAAAILASHDGTRAFVPALDTSALSMESMLWGPTGLAVVALSWSMLRSRQFSTLLCAVGMAGGSMLVVCALAFTAPRFSGVQEALQVGAPLIWVWMIWTGVISWRRAAAS